MIRLLTLLEGTLRCFLLPSFALREPLTCRTTQEWTREEVCRALLWPRSERKLRSTSNHHKRTITHGRAWL